MGLNGNGKGLKAAKLSAGIGSTRSLTYNAAAREACSAASTPGKPSPAHRAANTAAKTSPEPIGQILGVEYAGIRSERPPSQTRAPQAPRFTTTTSAPQSAAILRAASSRFPLCPSLAASVP